MRLSHRSVNFSWKKNPEISGSLESAQFADSSDAGPKSVRLVIRPGSHNLCVT